MSVESVIDPQASRAHTRICLEAMPIHPDIDWERVALDLGQRGVGGRPLGRKKSSRLIGRNVNWLRDVMSRAAQPRFSDGVRLLALWSEHTGKSVDQAPVTTRQYSAAQIHRGTR